MVAIEQPTEQPVAVSMNKLIQQYLKAKEAEAKAEKKRVDLGNQIAKALGAPDEGSRTHNLDGWSVKLTQPMNRKVDWTMFDVLIANAPGEHVPVKTKRELDVTGLRWLQENEPALYRQIAKAITATPGRVAVEIKAEK